MATIPRAAKSRQSLQHGQLGLFGVIMPGVAQVAPAFNLFFTTGLIVSLAGASAPLIFLISMVGMVATASSLAQFASIVSERRVVHHLHHPRHRHQGGGRGRPRPRG